ncbi:MAG: enolase C-terminal domain-like protein [Candidatus Bathyarchaeia archaeon]
MKNFAIIKNIKSRKIFDSRGSPTIEVEVITESSSGRASAPSGASRGRWEVVAYPSGGIDGAIEEVNESISAGIKGLNACEQENIDEALHRIDGTENFSKIGGNTAYAVSMAVASAAANSRGLPLFQHLGRSSKSQIPLPLGNAIGGGMHARGKKTDIQEFLVLPMKVNSFFQAAQANIKVHSTVQRVLERHGHTVGGKGDEGAWICDLETEEVLEVLSKATENIANEMGVEVRIGLDMAASTLWDAKKEAYSYERDKKSLSKGEQIDFVIDLIEKYKLVYVEDPLHEEDFEGFSELTNKVKETLICGDDLFTTNVKRLSIGIEKSSANAIIIKPNQVGTITDAYKTVELARSAGYLPIASHRSGDVCEPSLANLAIAFECPIIKTGIVGGERIVKINELIRIEELLSTEAKLAQIKFGKG